MSDNRRLAKSRAQEARKQLINRDHFLTDLELIDRQDGLPKRTTFEELTQMMVNLGFKDEINKMNEGIENDVKIADRNFDIEEGDDCFVKESKYLGGHLKEIDEDLEYFREGLLRAPNEKAEIEMMIDYLEGEAEKIVSSFSATK